MDEKYEEVYNILLGIKKLQKRKYDELVSKYGVMLVDRVIDDMIKKDDLNVFKFGYYISVKSDDISLDGADSYKLYISDIRFIPRLSYEENQTLSLEISDIISRMNVLFESKLMSKLSISQQKQFLITDKVEYWLANIDDLDSTNELKNLYLQFIEKRNNLVEGNLRLVIYIARRYNKYESEVPFNELIQFGNIGLMRAVEKYNPKMNAAFSTYACYWILQTVKRGIKNTAFRFLYMPHELIQLNNVRLSAIDVLSSQLGRSPTKKELANYMNVSVLKLEQIEESLLLPISINSAPISLCDDGRELFLIDCIEDYDASCEMKIFSKAMREQLMSILMDKTLFTERESFIILYLNGFLDGNMHTFEDTGKCVGVTKQRVKQIEEKLMHRLRGICKSRGMKDYL